MVRHLRVGFRGQYKVRNPDPVERTLGVEFTFPSSTAIYDQFKFRVNQQAADRGQRPVERALCRGGAASGGEALIEVAYDSRGLDQWSYALAENGMSEVSDFVLNMSTDFRRRGLPCRHDVATRHAATGKRMARSPGGSTSLVTGQQIGIDLPDRVNPGPLAARITFFAPVSLLFFLAVMVILGVLRQREPAPDELRVHLRGILRVPPAAGVPRGPRRDPRRLRSPRRGQRVLVVVYLRLVGGTAFALGRRAWRSSSSGAFSYAFFFEGFTGLTVTVGAIVTLFVLMQMTARVDWGNGVRAFFGCSRCPEIRRRCNRERPARRRHHGRQRPVGAGARAATCTGARGRRRAPCAGRSRRRHRSGSRPYRPMRSRQTTGSVHGLKSAGCSGSFARISSASDRAASTRACG